MSDMTYDIFADYSYGKVALKKLGKVDNNFRLYCAGWLSVDSDVMKITGGVFREALRGKNKGKLSILVKDSSRSVYVTVGEMEAYEKENSDGQV